MAPQVAANLRSPSDDSNETLSDCALNAAFALDRLIRGQQADKEAVQALARELRKTRVLSDEEGPQRLGTDPTTIDVLGRAIGEYNGARLETVGELSDKITELVGLFETDQEPETLRRLLKFCLALHQALLPRRGPFRAERETEEPA